MGIFDKIQRGEQTERLLNDPIMTDAFDAAREDCHKALEVLPMEDTNGIRNTMAVLKGLRLVEKKLERFVKEGKAARRKADEGKEQ